MWPTLLKSLCGSLSLLLEIICIKIDQHWHWGLLVVPLFNACNNILGNLSHGWELKHQIKMQEGKQATFCPIIHLQLKESWSPSGMHVQSHGSSSKGKGDSPRLSNELTDHTAEGTAVLRGLFPPGPYLHLQAQLLALGLNNWGQQHQNWQYTVSKMTLVGIDQPRNKLFYWNDHPEDLEHLITWRKEVFNGVEPFLETLQV
jgi:hypothetical protein